MVGDTIYDILGAAALGIPAIGVDWGYGESADMVKAGAKAIAYTTEDSNAEDPVQVEKSESSQTPEK